MKYKTVILAIVSITWYLYVIMIFYNQIHDTDGNIMWPDYGEMGNGVYLPEDKPSYLNKSIEKGWDDHSFNEFASNLISVRRKLPDYRLSRCRKSKLYLKSLPKTDVIICFHNEAWSVLLRTVHSVLSRSPANLLNSVILVDDFSTMNHLKTKLSNYWANYSKVKIYRTAKREGIVNARLLGFNFSTAPVVTFLDSHCECTNGWLVPLLDRVARNETTIACPRITRIDKSTFRYDLYMGKFDIPIGGFHWNLNFKWFSVHERTTTWITDLTEPADTPVMAGGLFSINRKFFEKLGLYDTQLDIWGAENMELSFKAWMCGGKIEIVPCSHVGHVFRNKSPYQWRNNMDAMQTLFNNKARVAEVWMDKFAQYFYLSVIMTPWDIGDLTERKMIKSDLKCKSFEWYLNNVYPEQYRPDRYLGYGQIYRVDIKENRNRFCITSSEIPVLGCDNKQFKVNAEPCQHRHYYQWFIYLYNLQIRIEDCCLDAYEGVYVYMTKCRSSRKEQQWSFWTKFLQPASHKDKCLGTSKGQLVLKKCSPTSDTEWKIQNHSLTHSFLQL